MAFLRNYTNGTVSDDVLNDKSQGRTIERAESIVGGIDLQTTSSVDKGFATKMEDEDDDSLLNLTTSNATTRKTTGRWGSTFWKDCQPMHQKHGSEESKSSSAYNNENGSGNDLSEVDKANKGQNVDEMLSDDYYELDGDDQSDSKLLNNAAAGGYNSMPLRVVSVNNLNSKDSSRGAYVEEDADFEDDDEEEEDGNLLIYSCL